jgi:murein DD-endopeptidase MepM/ murein hydrolase activator NlpD
VPPRPHPLVLAALALGSLVVMALVVPHGAGGAVGAGGVGGAAGTRADWHWPLRGAVVGAFHLTPRAPFARGQRRGIDVSAAPGAVVRAACPGRVTFAGPLPRRGLAVSVRCGALVATYLGLGGLRVRKDARVGRGKLLGVLGSRGRLRLGARRAAEPRGYADPLTLLVDPDPAAPPRLGPAPRAPRARLHPPLPAPAPALLPAPAPRGAPTAAAHRLPWPAYPAIAIVASALPLGGLVHRRRRRARSAAIAAASAAAASHAG